MALIPIDGGFFEPDTHAYYDPDGKWVVSVTQVLKLTGISNYDFVKQEVLDAKSELGTEVHDHAAELDKHGFVDPSWVSEKAVPHFKAYMKFRDERHFVPDPEWVERPVIAKIHGMLVGVTLDAFGKLDGHDTIVERKCVEAPLGSWPIQTAVQEMGRYKSTFCGRCNRVAIQLRKNGKYHLDHHRNHAQDASDAIACLAVVYARLRIGEKLWERV